MGKYERDWVEEAEKAVADSINGIDQDLHITKISNEIIDLIKKNIFLRLSVLNGQVVIHMMNLVMFMFC